jgi:hypothetical protein
VVGALTVAISLPCSHAVAHSTSRTLHEVKLQCCKRDRHGRSRRSSYIDRLVCQLNLVANIALGAVTYSSGVVSSCMC